jgi:arginine N-succinyltransferase
MSHVLRAADRDDLDALYKMAKRTGGGFTNLPPYRDYLSRKLEQVEASFTREATTIENDQFLFVVENAGTVVGTCQIFARTGSTWPFYSYRLDRVVLFSIALDRRFETETLTLCNDLDGCGEVGGLFLNPEERAGGVGKLLARSRYLFIKAHRERFPDRILAELRGVHDETGNSPVWDALAGRFFDMSFREADDFNAVHGNQFIAEVMPRHPIYTVLISDSARAVMGVPNPSGRAAMRMLANETFAFDNYIDIFDGGPTMIAATDSIRTITRARESTIVAVRDLDSEPELLAAGRLARFRACHGAIARTGDGVVIAPEAADLLQATPGDILLHCEA